MRRCLAPLCFLVAVPLLSAREAGTQAIRAAAGVLPETVMVGERFEVMVRIGVPAGFRVQLPEISASDGVQAVGPAARRRDADGTIVARYRLVAWQTGPAEIPPLRVQISPPGGNERLLTLPLPAPFVRSVLPADTAGVRPRPARGILSAAFPLRWLLAALAALLIAGWGLWRLRRRPESLARTSDPPLDPPDPRAWALAELERARSLGLIETESWTHFYALTSGAIRGFLAGGSIELGAELTTSELVRRLHEEGADAVQAQRLATLLEEADLVKFARLLPAAEEAERHWSGAKSWVEDFEAPAFLPTEMAR